MSFRRMRVIAWVAGILLLLIALATLTRNPLPWRDEVQFASVSQSLLEGRGGTPTVLAEDVRFPIGVFFYGPSFFAAGALFGKVLGLSAFSFRLVCWLFGAALAFAGSSLVRVLGGSRNWAAAAWLLLVCSPELGSTLSNGRMDTFAWAFLLGGLGLFIKSCQVTSRSALLLNLGAGALWAVGMLSTPRTLYFFLSLAICAPVVWVQRGEQRRTFTVRLIGAGVVAGASMAVSLSLQGENPSSWLAYLRRVGTYAQSASIVGGTFDLRPSPLWLFTPAAALLLLVTVRLSKGRLVDLWRNEPLVLWVAASLVLQSLLTFLTVVRPESYPLYYATPALVATLLLCSKLPASPAAKTGSRAHVWALAVILVFFGGLRVAKVGQVAAHWRQSDDRALNAFVRKQIPPGSRVLGPLEHYYYAVEKAGSHYLFFEALNDAYFPFLEDKRNPAYDRAIAEKDRASFVLCPISDLQRRGCRCPGAEPVAQFHPAAHRGFFARLPGGNDYRAAQLFRVPDGACGPAASSVG